MTLRQLGIILAIAATASTLRDANDAQIPLSGQTPGHHADPAVIAALQSYPDPVDAFLSVHPESADELAQPKLIRIAGEKEPEWMTEGDKMRLRRAGKKFIDVTDHHDFYKSHVHAFGNEPHTPPLRHKAWVKPLLTRVSTKRIHDDIEQLSGHYSRYYNCNYGAESARWLHDHLADIIKRAPFQTHISLDYFNHVFPQPSIIARFEPANKTFPAPLTIVGAHQDSVNQESPLLPAPGADDDGSGTVSILEAFRVLAESGYIPFNGPVEFHWYAAEEGGLLGSQAIARFKAESGAHIGALLDYDMTAFIAKNSTEHIALMKTDTSPELTQWTADLVAEYLSIPAQIYKLPGSLGTDYMPFARLGYPTAVASEGNPAVRGKVFGDLNPYLHTVNDTMNIDDDKGKYSIEHMARFSELAIAFVVEQARWDNAWR